MRKTKIFILIMALCLCAALAASALAESVLAGLWNSGCDFLFHTDNVTVTGEAVFSLDGERFKTAELNYVQDGYSSYYGLKLSTPRKTGWEQETGWIIIANEQGDYAVMEAYEPGVYRMGTGAPQNTLLRRSIQLDALTELGGFVAAQAEALLPEGAVTAAEADGGKNIHIAVAGDQIPEIAVSALNVAAGFLSDRWFGGSYDNTVVEDEIAAFDRYITVTQALTAGTVNWALRSADVDFTLDVQGRISAVNGTVKAASTFFDGSVREVEVQFSLAASDYGVSTVKPFDPDDYGVMLPMDFYAEDYGEEYGAYYGEMYPYEDELPEEDSWDAFVAGTAPLPPYVYTGDDPIEAAAAAYTAQMGLSFLVPENAAAIPAPLILKTERPDDTTALLYGNFWVFNYVLNGTALHCASGGDAPGVMTLKNTEAGWEVTSFEAAGEGEDFSRDIRRFCQGDEALEEAYYASQDAAQDPLKSVRQKFIQEYVTASGLDVTAYQDYGWNPVKLFPRENSVTVTAIPSEINPEQLTSVAVNARITAYSPEKNELTVEVIVPETYDRDEVLDLQIGDSIYTQGREITVETLREKYGYLVINEGDYEFSEGSVWLYEQFDGTFAIADWHDNTWATLAELHIPAGDALLFLDSIDPATGEILNMPSVHGAAEFLEMVKTETEEGGPGFAANNVYAVFDGAGQLAVIERYYVPWQ